MQCDTIHDDICYVVDTATRTLTPVSLTGDPIVLWAIVVTVDGNGTLVQHVNVALRQSDQRPGDDHASIPARK